MLNRLSWKRDLYIEFGVLFIAELNVILLSAVARDYPTKPLFTCCLLFLSLFQTQFVLSPFSLTKVKAR